MLDEKIKTAIQESLPSVVAGELKDYISKAEDTKDDLEDAKEKITSYKVEVKALKSEIKLVEMRLENFIDIEQREGYVLSKEAELKLREEVLSLKEDFSQTRVLDMKDVLGLVFKNTEVRKNIFKTENVPLVNPNGYVEDRTRTENTTIDETVE